MLCNIRRGEIKKIRFGKRRFLKVDRNGQFEAVNACVR